MLLLLVLLSTGCARFERQALCQQGYDAAQRLFVTLYVLPADRWADTRAWGSEADVELEKAVMKAWRVVYESVDTPIGVVVEDLGGGPHKDGVVRNWGPMTHRFRKLTPGLVGCIKRETDEKGEPLGEANLGRLRAFLQGILYACRDQQFRPRVRLVRPGEELHYWWFGLNRIPYYRMPKTKAPRAGD